MKLDPNDSKNEYVSTHCDLKLKEDRFPGPPSDQSVARLLDSGGGMDVVWHLTSCPHSVKLRCLLLLSLHLRPRRPLPLGMIVLQSFSDDGHKMFASLHHSLRVHL